MPGHTWADYRGVPPWRGAKSWKEAQMRWYRITFVGGLAIGYVLGAQAGRERYEQLKQLAKKAAESPAMQQTAGALQAQATATAKSAKEMAANGVRQSASKLGGKRPGSSAASVPGNGSKGPARQPAEGDGARPFVPASASFGEHDLI